MPAFLETARETAAAAPPPQLANYCYKPGAAWRGNAKGRPIGAKASKVITRAETKVAMKAVEIALNDKHREQGGCVRQLLDKYVPDAGTESRSGEVVPIFVIVAPSTDAADGMSHALTDADAGLRRDTALPALDAETSAGTDHV